MADNAVFSPCRYCPNRKMNKTLCILSGCRDCYAYADAIAEGNLNRVNNFGITEHRHEVHVNNSDQFTQNYQEIDF